MFRVLRARQNKGPMVDLATISLERRLPDLRWNALLVWLGFLGIFFLPGWWGIATLACSAAVIAAGQVRNRRA